MSRRPNIWGPLDPKRRQIRLFHLQPSEDIHDQAKGFLEIVSLDDNPQYEALSYAWGDPNITCAIKLHEIQWEVTTNLEAGLRHLRGTINPKVLWIDAICIDQGSNEEKNYQVPLMKTIYINASIVRVWLGKGTEGSDKAMRILNELGHGDPPRLANVRIDGRALDMEDLGNLRDLFTRSWWRRIWVQQEFVLATELAMHCGSHCLNHYTLSKFVVDVTEMASGWDYSPYDYTVLREFVRGFSVLKYFVRMREDHDYFTHAEISPANVQTGTSFFLRSLCLGRDYTCANPRDFIYGLLGLAPNDFASIVNPDYSLSIAQVFQHMAVLFIVYTNSLTVFSATEYQPKDQRLTPTWVPDWRRPVGAKRLSGSSVFDQVTFASCGLFNACGQRELRFELGSDSVVTLSGIILDRVGALTAAATAEDQPNKYTIERDWRRFFDYHILGTLDSFYPSSESPESPYWRLLTLEIRTLLRAHFLVWLARPSFLLDQVSVSLSVEI